MATETAETRRGTRIYHERRSDERHTTIMRFAALRTFAGHHLCIVRDLTSKGAKLQTHGKLQPGASVYLDMQPDEPVAGEVVWSSGEHAGVRFHTKMDVLRTSAIGDSGRRRQVPRFELECSGLVRTGAQSLHVRLRNITLAGAAISNVEGLKMSTPISLSMPDMPPLEAVVSWTDGDVAGLTFKKRLPVDTLAVWIEQHQSLLATGSSYNRRSEVSEQNGPAVPHPSPEEHPTGNGISSRLGAVEDSSVLRGSETPLFELLYVSNSTLYVPDDEAIVAEILAAARERNRHLGLTGGLIFTQRHFVQYLEGEETSIAEVMASIRRDPRHRDIKLVYWGRCDARRFADWGMAYSGPSVFVSQQVATLLMNTGEAELETRANYIMSMMEEFSAHSKNKTMKKVA